MGPSEASAGDGACIVRTEDAVGPSEASATDEACLVRMQWGPVRLQHVMRPVL